MRFRPSQHSQYGESTTLSTTALSMEATLASLATGAVAGGAAGAGIAAASAGGGHLSKEGFLGLNWRSIGASVLIGSCVAIGTDLVLSFLKPRLFKKNEPEKK